jgi:hypothetical protein
MQASPLKFITSLDIFKSPELTLNCNFAPRLCQPTETIPLERAGPAVTTSGVAAPL